jgi:hypothetical protein
MCTEFLWTKHVGKGPPERPKNGAAKIALWEIQTVRAAGAKT